jgi:hypothetical protein
MKLLRIAGLLFVPALLHAGFLNIQLSAMCGVPFPLTTTASSDSATCSGPDGGSAQAEGDFSNLGAAGFVVAFGTLDRSVFFSATISIQAAYQVTFSGAEGPGYMEATVCLNEDSLGNGSVSVITPNGSISRNGTPFQTVCGQQDIPIVFGVPLDIQLSLQASAFATCCGVGGESFASVDFSYQALDANKSPVPFTAEVVVPEPSTWHLWMVGVCLLFLARLRTPQPRAKVSVTSLHWPVTSLASNRQPVQASGQDPATRSLYRHPEKLDGRIGSQARLARGAVPAPLDRTHGQRPAHRLRCLL